MAARIIEFSDGLFALLPLIRKRLLGSLCPVYWSSAANTYGGWITSRPLTSEHGRMLAVYLLSFKNIVWRENPFDPHANNLALPGATEDFTQVVDLSSGIDAAIARSDYAHRRAVRKAIDSGVTVIEASNFDTWLSYFSLYKASRLRWHKRKLVQSREYSHDFFHRIFECPQPNRKLWLALREGAPIAGTLCFYCNKHAVSWSSAGIAELFNRYRPNDLLYDRAIRHAAENGYRWFDCNPSMGLQGVIDFKQHIGAQKMRSRVINCKSPLRQCVEALRKILPL